MHTATHFRQVRLETGPDGRACFVDAPIGWSPVKPTVHLSPWRDAEGLQLRFSPVGFESDFHCTEVPQWLVVLQGAMEIGLHDGTWRRFDAGDHFYSADTLPAGEAFDATRHGHRSRQVGDVPLVTLFVREAPPR